jgi:hypothetical protein
MCKGQDNQPKRGKKWKPKRLTRTAKTAKDSARRVTEPRLFFAVTRNWDATKRLKSKYQKGEKAMKTIEKAEQQARNGGYDNFVIFSWTSSRGNRLFGHCTLRSPLYAWLTKNEGAEMFSGYVEPKIEKYCY